MTMNVTELFNTAVKPSSENFKAYHSDAAVEAMKTATILQAVKIRGAYQLSYNGRFALNAVLAGTAALYLASFFLAPTLFPLGIAAMSAYYINAIVAAAAVYFALTSGVALIQEGYANLVGLYNRFKNSNLTSHDVAGLVTTSLALGGLAATMYALPNLIPALSALSPYYKAGTAATLGIASAASLYGALFGRRGPGAGGDASKVDPTKKEEVTPPTVNGPGKK